MPARLRTTAAAVATLALALAGCGSEQSEKGTKEPAREGLAIPLAGVEYDVFITRELNLRAPPDMAYYKGPEARKGETLYGVFLQSCNHTTRPQRTASEFRVIDNQGNTFLPTPLPRDNAFAYQPRTLLPQQCEPEAGSVAQLGPTAGSMLLFRLPLANTENRPLELEVTAGSPPQSRRFTLDL